MPNPVSSQCCFSSAAKAISKSRTRVVMCLCYGSKPLFISGKSEERVQKQGERLEAFLENHGLQRRQEELSALTEARRS